MKVHGCSRSGGDGDSLGSRGKGHGALLLTCGALALACSRTSPDPDTETKPAGAADTTAQPAGSASQATAAGQATVTKHSAHHDPAATAGLEPMQHAFFLVGREHPFLVHMTNMWMDAHLYQLVLRVTLPEAMREAYEKDRAQHPDDWYIVGNVADDKMVIADLARGAKSKFRGSLWRSWPAAEGDDPHWPWSATPPVVADFEVQVERVVHYRHFDWNLERPRSLTYLLFGEGEEAHMQSYQIRQPDFDHTVSLSSPPSWLPPALLEAGVHVNFPGLPSTPGKADSAAPSRADVYCKAPVGPGAHQVQLGGQEQKQPLEIARTVFFGTYPVNEVDPCAPPPAAKAAKATPDAKGDAAAKAPPVWHSGRK